MEGKEHVGNTTLLTCVQPFGQWNRFEYRGKGYRALKTKRYTYARDLNGPWLLFDNIEDSHQMNNLVDHADFASLLNDLDQKLTQRLEETGDKFLPEWNTSKSRDTQ